MLCRKPISVGRPLRRKHLLVALMLPFLAALFLTAATTPLPPSSDDVSIAKSIEAYIYGRSETLRLRVDSLSINKVGAEVQEGTYCSAWEITLRFRADYARPEEDPYLAGMLKCFNELKAGSDAAWVKWAEDEIDLRRAEVQDLISYVQERQERVTAYAQVDGSGRIFPDTVKLQVEGTQGAHTVQDLLRAVPGPEYYEDAGYKYLGDKSGEPGAGAGGQQGAATGGQGEPATSPKSPPESKGEPGPTPGTAPAQTSPQVIKPTTRSPEPRTGDNDSKRSQLILFATGLILILIVILIVSEAHSQKRKHSGRR